MLWVWTRMCCIPRDGLLYAGSPGVWWLGGVAVVVVVVVVTATASADPLGWSLIGCMTGVRPIGPRHSGLSCRGAAVAVGCLLDLDLILRMNPCAMPPSSSLSAAGLARATSAACLECHASPAASLPYGDDGDVGYCSSGIGDEMTGRMRSRDAAFFSIEATVQGSCRTAAAWWW